MRSWLLFTVLASLVLAGGCARSADPPGSRPYQMVTEDYLPGVAADVYLPTGVVSAPLVVMVPGGAWLTADRSGFTPLARRLAGAGIVTVNATHRAVRSGARFPQPVGDVRCSIDFAVSRAAKAGITIGPVVVLGHSSGAHLAALAALSGDALRRASPYPPAHIDGLIGLAGAYDVRALHDLAEPLFGSTPAQDPAAWRDGDPTTWIERGPKPPTLRAFLAHGTADDLSVTFTTSFADALRKGGFDVSVAMVDGATHATIYRPEVIAERILAWLATVPAPQVSTSG